MNNPDKNLQNKPSSNSQNSAKQQESMNRLDEMISRKRSHRLDEELTKYKGFSRPPDQIQEITKTFDKIDEKSDRNISHLISLLDFNHLNTHQALINSISMTSSYSLLNITAASQAMNAHIHETIAPSMAAASQAMNAHIYETIAPSMAAVSQAINAHIHETIAPSMAAASQAINAHIHETIMPSIEILQTLLVGDALINDSDFARSDRDIAMLIGSGSVVRENPAVVAGVLSQPSFDDHNLSSELEEDSENDKDIAKSAFYVPSVLVYNPQRRIFLSYKWGKQSKANVKILWKILSRDYQVFYDDFILHGEHIWERIQYEIELAPFFILVVDQHVFTKDNGEKSGAWREYQLAKEQQKIIMPIVNYGVDPFKIPEFDINPKYAIPTSNDRKDYIEQIFKLKWSIQQWFQRVQLG